MNDEGHAGRGNIRPVPDPTELTTKALQAAIDGLEKLMDQKLEAVTLQISAMERQRVEQKADSYRELTAAFNSAERLVSLTNTHIEQQLAQMQSTFNEA